MKGFMPVDSAGFNTESHARVKPHGLIRVDNIGLYGDKTQVFHTAGRRSRMAMEPRTYSYRVGMFCIHGAIASNAFSWP